MAFNAAEVAEVYHVAMKGIGTDESLLVAKTSALNNEQLQQVRSAFANNFGKDLIECIKSECSGLMEAALVGLIQTRSEFDASQLHGAMKGLGTDEAVFVQTLCHRTTEESLEIEEAYRRLFKRELKDAIRGDFSRDAQLVALGMIKYDRDTSAVAAPEVDTWVDDLYKAGEGRIGTSEQTFIEAICGYGPEWLDAMNAAYSKKYSRTLAGAVREEFSGFAADALETMLMAHDEYYADLLHKACAGVGTRNEALLRVIVGRRHKLHTINQVFVSKYGKTISEWIAPELSGKVKDLLVQVAESAQQQP